MKTNIATMLSVPEHLFGVVLSELVVEKLQSLKKIPVYPEWRMLKLWG